MMCALHCRILYLLLAMALVNPVKVIQFFLGILFYITLAIDFTWWSLIQKGEVATTTYDYIVVGGGTGGSVAAGRLAQNGTYNVLLLEAGAAPSPLHRVPLLGVLCQHSHYDWAYLTEPQSGACLGMDQQRAFWPSGRILGGSSQLNFMLYVRGQRRDFDRWGRLNPGWSYADVRPFFERSVTYLGDKSHLGSEGPWHIARGSGITALDDIFVQAAQWLGFKLLDYNSESAPGIYYVDSNVVNGYRNPLNTAFLHGSDNLHVVTNALVDKVEIESLRATGVTFIKFGERLTVRARREVVLAAGAFNTPTVLLRSGVGPAKHLRHIGITPVVDLPVGERLETHIGAPLVYLIRKPYNLLPDTAISALSEYIVNGTGHLASNLCNSGLFLASARAESADWPDVQLMLCNLHYWAEGAGGGHNSNAQRQLFDSMLTEANETTHGVSLVPCLLRPRSRGHVRLSSAEPTAPPLIQPNFLRDHTDTEVLVEGLRMAAKLAATPPLRDLIIRQVVLKPCQNVTGDAQLECQLRHLTLTIYHPTSTCRMAPRDQGGVVDHHLRVYGVSALRVMDASVMPFVTSGNTNAPVAMIAEKGADMVLRAM